MVTMLAVAVALSSAGRAQEFEGRLALDPSPAYVKVAVMLNAADDATLPEPVTQGAEVFEGTLWGPFRGTAVALVTPPGGVPYAYVDRNGNTALEANERVTFQASAERPGMEATTRMRLPIECGSFQEMPVDLMLMGLSPAGDRTRRALAHSAAWIIGGTVPIDGRQVRVGYSYSCDTGAVDPRNGFIGLDENGDGQIDWSGRSMENARADDETIVFRVGDRYVSTSSVDVESGRIIIRSLPASDYERIDWAVGGQVPDFVYTDFEGERHRLSDLGAQYVLLDFWFATCGPCIAEIPTLKQARDEFGSRGFEILSLTRDDEPEMDAARGVVAKHSLDWPQGAGETVRHLVNHRFRVVGYPSHILLGPDRRILSAGGEGEEPLRGDALLETLAKLLRSGG